MRGARRRPWAWKVPTICRCLTAWSGTWFTTLRRLPAHVHLRNVRDKVPHYKETFIDDGEVDVLRVLAILKRNGFDGVIIPDHAPQMSCAAPWHAGMAFAMGYLKAGLQTLESNR